MKLLEQDKVIKDTYLLQLDSFLSERGENLEPWNRDTLYKVTGKNFDFKSISVSISKYRSARGYHADSKNTKLLFVTYGEVFLSILDLRKESITYGKHQEFILNDKNRIGIIIPPEVFNFHVCMSGNCVFNDLWTYRYTTHEEQYPTFKFYKAESEFGVILPKFDQGYITSERDT